MHCKLMTEEQEKLALDLINNPPPGSAIAKAREFGVDLTLFISTSHRARKGSLPWCSYLSTCRTKRFTRKMNLEETLLVLCDAGVEFVLIGGAAMGLQGSPHVTQDMAFCYERSRPNLERLAKALKPNHPRCAVPRLVCRFTLIRRRLPED